LCFIFLCAVYNQIQHKLQMPSPSQLDYLEQQAADTLFDYNNQLAARAKEAARAAAAKKHQNIPPVVMIL
jgi:hypothetical protein